MAPHEGPVRDRRPWPTPTRPAPHDAAERTGAAIVTFEEAIARDDVDIVDLCTPPSLHLEQITAALAAGKHVVCEKPLVASLRDCDTIAAARPPAPIAPDLELAVVSLLRRAALEDDHRGDGVLGADVGDVEALDPHRQLVEAERLLEGGEGVDALLAPALAPQPVLGERELRVALGELAQPALVAALGDADLDRAPRRELSASATSALRSRIAGPTTTSPGTAGAAE